MFFGDKKKDSRENRDFQVRIALLALMGATAAALLIARTMHLTIARGKSLYEESVSQSRKEEDIPAPRGMILDRNGKVIATSKPGFNLLVNPEGLSKNKTTRTLEVTQTLEAIKRNFPGTRNLPRVIDVIDSWRLYKRLKPARLGLTLAEVTSLYEMESLASLQIAMPGLQIEPTFLRSYPFGTASSHLTGHVGPISPKALDAYLERGYGRNDIIGQIGLEHSFEAVLRGEKGEQIVSRNARRVVLEARVVEGSEAVRGGNLTLTIDMDLQVFATRLLEKKRVEGKDAVAVVMDPRNGEILAMASVPHFDANYPARAGLPGNSSYHRALAEHYWPGSTFKLITATAWLKHNQGSPERKIDCVHSYKFGKDGVKTCMGYHGKINLRQAIERSCNYYFYAISKEVSLDNLIATAEDFGFGQKTGIEINARGDIGILGRDTSMVRTTLADRLNLGIGQGDLLKITPLQMAVAYSAMANGGTRYNARIIREIKLPGSPAEVRASVARGTIGWTPAQRAIILQGMRDVIATNRGTAHWDGDERTRFDPKLHVAGKTGTAERGKFFSGANKPTDAWFACFAPWDKPEICIVVMVESAGHGGEASAPIANEILLEYYRLKAGDDAPTTRTAQVKREPAISME